MITDIIVELEDGSLANVEIQKISYSFSGEHSACYSSDMLPENMEIEKIVSLMNCNVSFIEQVKAEMKL